MPVFCVNGDLHYFAHVPKCGGSSVEGYLRHRFGTLGFIDTRHLDLPEGARWTRSSPQHVTAAAFHRLMPPEWIKSSFAVVRHPVARLVSAFKYQIEVEGTVAALWSIDDWFAHWLTTGEKDPFRYDNHLRPQHELVPEGATVFHLENGLDPIVAHLDALAGNSAGPRKIEAENVRKTRFSPEASQLVLSPAMLARVAEHYAEDFRRFGYAPDAPKSRRTGAGEARGLLRRLTDRFAGPGQ